MSTRLRSLYQNTPFYKTNINTTISSAWVDIGSWEGPFSIHVVWESGVTPTMDVTLEVSNDKINFATYGGSSQAISGVSGGHFYDLAETGAQFIRVRIAVNAGSAVISTLFNGKARA